MRTIMKGLMLLPVLMSVLVRTAYAETLIVRPDPRDGGMLRAGNITSEECEMLLTGVDKIRGYLILVSQDYKLGLVMQ